MLLVARGTEEYQKSDGKSFSYRIHLFLRKVVEMGNQIMSTSDASKNHILLYIDVQKYNCDNINNKIDIVNLNI